MTWFRRHVWRPDKGLHRHWQRAYGSGVVAFGMPTRDPPVSVGPAVRRMFKRCARQRQRVVNRRLVADGRGEAPG